MEWLCKKTRSAGKLIRSLKMEPFIFLFVLGTNVSEITRTQLMQDKICINRYNQTHDYCIELSKIKAVSDQSDDQDQIKNKILADVARFSTYTTIISTLPAFFYMLFIGPWIDSYIHGRKIILCLGTFGYAGWYGLQLLNAIKFEWDINYFLLSYIPVVLFGGWNCVWMIVFSYMANNSSKKNRFLRFASFELAQFIGGPTGVYLGGLLLGRGNYNINGNIHNYERTFLFSLSTSVIGFFWVLFVINENKPKNSKKCQQIDENQNTVQNKDESIVETNFSISKMFDLNNLKEIFKTAVKLRPNKGRAKIWLLYLSMGALMLSEVRFFNILFPYTEKMFEWDATYFSNIKSLTDIMRVVMTALTTGLLSGYLKLSDTKIGIIGWISIFIADISIGSILYPIGVYIMFLTSSPSAITALSIRSLLTKIAPESESGKIFALLGALEQVIPSLQVLLTNSLFEYTVDFYPSLCFQIATVFNFFPLFVFFWIDLIPNQIK